jgi:hypothetical protein
MLSERVIELITREKGFVVIVESNFSTTEHGWRGPIKCFHVHGSNTVPGTTELSVQTANIAFNY